MFQEKHLQVLSEIPFIFPTPRKLTLTKGVFRSDHLLKVWAAKPEFRKTIEEFHPFLQLELLDSEQDADLKIHFARQEDQEAYKIQIKPNEIFIEVEESVGLFRALNTIYKLVESGSDFLPCMLLEDRPVLSRRGFMLDISRCKVPTMKCILELIDLLGKLGYNELQLYIEHTFAFKDHLTVWENSSPLTPKEIQLIDCHCKKRYIELVPNLNSFGHFERWLRHKEYHHLAECPNGFRREEPFMERDHGSTLKPNSQSLEFMDLLYAEYLPNFSSKNFNVGMDEPWELGQGWSAGEVKRLGKGKVYLKHLSGIRKLVEKHHKNMQFWADVLLEEPENAKLLPHGASPIIWGYEADHPFEEQAKVVASCGLGFCLAPGTSTWRSFGGRWKTAKDNIAQATRNAIKYQAEGILLTSWGDGGNHQPWYTFLPALSLAAQWAWSGTPPEDDQVNQTLNQLVFKNSESDPGNLLMEFGTLDEVIDSRIPNASLTWNLLFSSQPDMLPEFLNENSSRKILSEGVEYLNGLHTKLEEMKDFSECTNFQCDLSLGIELSIISLKKGLSILSGSSFCCSSTDQIVNRYERNWLKKARVGGLEESSTLLRSALLSG